MPSGDMAREETLSRWAMKVLIQSPIISGGRGGEGRRWLPVRVSKRRTCLSS